MKQALLAVLMTALFAGSVWALADDIHIVGVQAVNPAGAAQGTYDRDIGDVICVEFQFVEVDGSPPGMVFDGPEPSTSYDVEITMEDSEGTQVLYCCWPGVNVPALNTVYTVGPAVPPADFLFECCYQLQPTDPIGNYVITVQVLYDDGTDDCDGPPATSWSTVQTSVTGVVPVELASFEALVEARNVEIRWETASEEGNLGFFVLRSGEKDGDYERLSDLIEARGSSSTGASYSFVDESLNDGVYFYMLEDIATDGFSTLHEPARAVVGDTQSWGSLKSEFSE